MTVLTDKPKVGWTDAALLAEELTDIYSTPTPKGWLEPKKVSILYLIDCVSSIQWPEVYIYTLGWHKSPNHTRLDNT